MKRSKMVPSDYIDADQSDSDPGHDRTWQPGENDAPSSPIVSQEVSTSFRRKRQAQCKKKFTGTDANYEATRENLADERNRISSPTHEEDDDEIPVPREQSPTTPKRKYDRKHKSVVWDHATQENDNLVKCNHCTKFWVNLGGSTSTPLKHIREHHYDFLTQEQRNRMKGMTHSTPTRRTIKKVKSQDEPLPRSHVDVQKLDSLLGNVIISSNDSWHLLKNRQFAELCGQFLEGRYNLPTQSYMVDHVINPVFTFTKELIKNKLKNTKYIGLTTDAWTSIGQKYYITITAHLIDEDSKMVCYVLDTEEIQNRHTKDHLLAHIQKVLLSQYDIEVENNHRLTLMFNATNTQDIHKQDSESDTDINYLEKETEHAELTINNEDDDDATQLDDFLVNIRTEENNQNTQNCGPVTSTPVLTDVCDDNGSEIAESIKKLG